MATIKNSRLVFELEADNGEHIDSIYKSLQEYNVGRKYAFCVFNGIILTSTDSLDDIYLKVTCKNKSDYDNFIIKQEPERDKDFSTKSIDGYYNRGLKTLRIRTAKDKKEWLKTVTDCVNGMYYGEEIQCVLEIAELLKYDEFDKATEKFKSQNHSGNSEKIVLSIIKRFSYNSEVVLNKP